MFIYLTALTEVSPPVTSKRIKGYFCSENVFNLSKKVLNEIEIKVLEKGLGFVPTPNIINEEDLRRDFGEFSRKMRCKWYFRDEPYHNFREVPVFRPKSNWKPPPGHPCVELFLSKLESELFSFLPGKSQAYNLTKEEWLAMRNLAEDRSIIIKPADKGSCVVVWDREDYLAEGYKQLWDTSTYVEVKKDNDQLLSQLTEKINKFFKRLYNNKLISEKELKYFSYNFKNTSCLGKMYLLPKTHKRLNDVPGRPVISNCDTPTEKLSEFLYHHLQPIMKAGKSYIKDTIDFLEKLKNLGNIPSNAILVTVDVVGLYPSIPHDAGLQVLYEKLEERTDKKIPSTDLVEMAHLY